MRPFAAERIPNPNLTKCVNLQVFQPSHILPSLTVEQQGLIELEEARKREAIVREANNMKVRQGFFFYVLFTLGSFVLFSC